MIENDLENENILLEEEYIETPFDEEAFHTIIRLYDKTFKDLVNR